LEGNRVQVYARGIGLKKYTKPSYSAKWLVFLPKSLYHFQTRVAKSAVIFRKRQLEYCLPGLGWCLVMLEPASWEKEAVY